MHPYVDPTGAYLVYTVGVPLVLLLIAFEAIFCAVRGWHYYNRSDTLGSLGLLAGNIIVNASIKASTLGLYLYLYQFRLLDLNELLPLWAIWLLSFVAIDFTFYWYHRMSHRVHHGSNPEYIDKNYGNLFIIWDRMFGTFEPERATVRYGLRTNIKTSNPFEITVTDWVALWREMRSANDPLEALGYFFGPPDWEPARLRKVSPIPTGPLPIPPE